MSQPHVPSSIESNRPSASSVRAALAFALGIAIACLVGFQLGAVHTATASAEPVAHMLGTASALPATASTADPIDAVNYLVAM